MENSNINYFDAAVAVMLVTSGIFAFRRGLIREVMALGTWVIASVFAFSVYPVARPFFNEHIKNPMLADASTAIALFCLAIVTLVPLGEYIAGLVKTPTISSIDRSLGFVFGIIRGFLVACLIYLGLTFIWPEDKPDVQPKWLEEARTKPALSYGVELVKSVSAESVEAAQDGIEEGRAAAEEAAEAARHLEDISTPVPVYSLGKDAKPSSYGDETRSRMNDLMDRN